MYNYTCVHENRVECPHVWLFHPWHNTRHVHSTHGITWDVSIPCYGECGPHKHITRFGLPMSCYHAFPSVEKWSYNWAVLYIGTHWSGLPKPSLCMTISGQWHNSTTLIHHQESFIGLLRNGIKLLITHCIASNYDRCHKNTWSHLVAGGNSIITKLNVWI